jgi:hypothetical protein
MLARVTGLTQIILGLVIWVFHPDAVIPVHIAVGLALVLSLWTLAFLAAEAGVSRGLVALAVLWGFLAPALGLTQGQLLVGDYHWVIQALHLLVGLVAIGLANGLAARIRRTQAPQPQPPQQPAEPAQGQGQGIATEAKQPMKRPNRVWRVVRAVLVGPVVLVALGVAVVFAGMQATALPPAINMSSTGDMSNMGDMGDMNMPPAPLMPSRSPPAPSPHWPVWPAR